MKHSWFPLISLLFVVLFMTACASDSGGDTAANEPTATTALTPEVAIDTEATQSADATKSAEATQAGVPLVATVDAAVNATLTAQAIEFATASPPPGTMESVMYTATAASVRATRIAEATQAAENFAPSTPELLLTPTPEVFTTPIPEPEPFTPTPPPPPTDVPQTACLSDLAFEEDVTIPDDSYLAVGDATVKTWRVRNTGTCKWERNSYTLVPFEGEPIGVLATNPVPSAEPGESVELSLVFIAPLTPGDYQSSWRMQDGSGTPFGPPLTVIFKAEDYEHNAKTVTRLNPPLLVPVDPAFWSNTGVSQDTLIPMDTHPYLGGSFAGDIATMHANGTLFKQLTTYGYNGDPRPSPNGERIAYRSVHRNVTALIQGPDDFHYNYQDGGYFNIWALAVDSVDTFWQVTDGEIWRSPPVWSPDSQSVAFIEGQDNILVSVHLEQQTRKEWAEDVTLAKYLPDGSGITYVTTAGDLVRADAHGVVDTLISASSLPPEGTIFDFAWLPDSQHLLYTLKEPDSDVPFDLGKYSAWIVNADGTNPIKLADGIRTVNPAPDGIWVASESGSGYGDACFIDIHLSFLKLSPERTSAEVFHVDNFANSILTEEGQTFYPISDPIWIEGRLIASRLGVTCYFEDDAMGHYLIDPVGQQLVQITRTLVP